MVMVVRIVVNVVITVSSPPIVVVYVVVKAVVVVAVVTGRQIDAVTLLLSNVTAPFCARARPFKRAPVAKVMLATARIFPVN
jgi:hypothetical protein